MIIINFYILRNINIQPQHTIILKHIHESDRERFIITARGSKFINKLLWLLLVVCLIIHVVFLHVLVRIGDSALHVTWLQLSPCVIGCCWMNFALTCTAEPSIGQQSLAVPSGCRRLAAHTAVDWPHKWSLLAPAHAAGQNVTSNYHSTTFTTLTAFRKRIHKYGFEFRIYAVTRHLMAGIFIVTMAEKFTF